jgi:hypothetical protein
MKVNFGNLPLLSVEAIQTVISQPALVIRREPSHHVVKYRVAISNEGSLHCRSKFKTLTRWTHELDLTLW